ncbi:Mce-associated membrane protein [Streptosporangium album]|uniref:Mce-associated membrane protein n=1 Tax=Streptosporangium album TaxID=47479 RepID=A0A7W7S273_9ACTN|nr:hypothetical protein [Streptosporangium album]MBB4941591.1 Mce-associated membrane protein [Streptosporangium album]
MSPVPQEPEELPRGAGSAHGGIGEDGGEPTEPNSAAASAVRAALDRAAAERAAAESDRSSAHATRLASRGKWTGAAMAVALASAATIAALQWMAAGRLTEEKSERDAVFARAREFAVALQTYDYSNLSAYRDQVLAISDDTFEKTYDEAFGPLKDVITSMKASSSASVRGVYVAELARDRAKAITVVDSQVTSTAGIRRMLGTSMQIALVKTGGQWKISDATVMGAADELVTDPQGRTVEPAPAPSPGAARQDE